MGPGAGLSSETALRQRKVQRPCRYSVQRIHALVPLPPALPASLPSALPEAPDALRALARQLDRTDRHDDAVAVYRRLLALQPGWLDGWYNLGQALWRARRFDDALAAYQHALDGGIAQPEEVHLNRSVLYAQHLADPEAARQELDCALALNPHYLPAWLNLGNLHEQSGDRMAAAQAYERALAIDPRHALALSRLPNLRRLHDPQDPLIARLQQALSDPRRHPAERADLGFGLGKALDDVGRHDDAFAAYGAANAASRQAAGPAARYDRAAHERHVDRLTATFTAPTPARKGDPDQAPIFICGLFRSGSTLVERMLAAHPRVTAGGELDLLPAIARQQLPPGGDWPLLHDPATLQAVADGYRADLARRFPYADLLTDKRPDNVLHVGLIKTLFPSARIVITRRHPLDNGLSMYFLHLGWSMPYALDLGDLGHWIAQHDRLVAHWCRVYGDDVHVVDYDALVADPEPPLRALLAFCGLAWDPACLAFHTTGGAVQTASLWQVRQPLYRHASGRWQHYARHLGPLRDALGWPPDREV